MLKTVIAISGMTTILRGSVEIYTDSGDGIVISHTPYTADQRAYIHVHDKSTLTKLEVSSLDVL